MKRLINKLLKTSYLDNRGETLIEMVISLALFSLTITMLVTVFQSSNLSLAESVETKRTIFAKEADAYREDNLEDVGEVQNITYTITTSEDSISNSFTVRLSHVENSSFYIFR